MSSAADPPTISLDLVAVMEVGGGQAFWKLVPFGPSIVARALIVMLARRNMHKRPYWILEAREYMAGNST